MPTSRDVLLDETNLALRRRVRVVRDPSTGLVLVQEEQDGGPALRAAAEARAAFDAAAARRAPARLVRVASIPTALVNRFRRAGVWGDDKAMMKLLSSSEYRHLRTDDGRRLG